MVDSHLRGWSVLETGTYYPKKATALFRQLLHNITNPEESRVIDVGASFGWFSLLARKYNVKVDVFEPNLVNVIRICESIEENKWNNRGFDIYPYGLTEEDGTLLFQYHEDGTARANENWGHKSQAFALDSFARERGWLERNDEDIRILKVDVGNHVPQVLAGASELLSSGMVKSLILDLRIRHKGDKESCMQAIQQIMNAGFELQMYGDELGPASKSPWKHDTELPRNIIEAMEKAEHNWEMTFWWKRKDS
jgi:FkbM family methyltransferase